jgi:uncharacterized protein (TIGR02246 family)
VFLVWCSCACARAPASPLAEVAGPTGACTRGAPPAWARRAPATAGDANRAAPEEETMKRLLLVALAVPVSLALAADEKTAAAPEDPMAGWVPPKVKNEAKDKREIQALIGAMETAAKRGDLDAAAALVDFPVLMVTDDSKGEAMGEPWERERWTEVMKPFYDKPMKDMKVTHKPTIFLLSDSLASVDDVSTMSMGGKTLTSRNSMLVIRRDGKWLVKAMAEGGWGDMMAAGAEAQGTGSGSPTGAESSGSGSSASPDSTPATSGAPDASTTTDTEKPPERTTK